MDTELKRLQSEDVILPLKIASTGEGSCEEKVAPNMSMKLLTSEVDGEDELSLIAEELNKVESHSQLATVIQSGYGRKRRDPAVRFRETLARIGRREGEGKGGFLGRDGEDDDLTMFTAERSLHNKLGSSRIMVDSSVEESASLGRVEEDVMSEYDASHGVESFYNSFSGSQTESSPESPKFSLGKATMAPFNEDVISETEEEEEGEVSTGCLLESERAPLTAACWPETDEVQAVATGSIEVQTVIEVTAANDVIEQTQQLGVEEQSCLEECSLTPDERLRLRLEEMEMKVDFLMNRLQNAEYRVPGYMVLRIPTVDAIGALTLTKAKAFTLQVVRTLECFWPLRPLILAVNVVEDISCAVFSRLPILGVPEKQWM